MKNSILLSLLIGMMGVIAFMGCERETIDPNEGQPQRADEDSLINQQGDTLPDKITVEHWGAISPLGYYDYSEGVNYPGPYTYAYLDIYPLDSILRAVDVNPNDDWGLYFTSENGYPYSMNGDTIRVYWEDPNIEITEEFQRWRIYHISTDTMYWKYMGVHIPESHVDYKFYLIGVE